MAFGKHTGVGPGPLDTLSRIIFTTFLPVSFLSLYLRSRCSRKQGDVLEYPFSIPEGGTPGFMDISVPSPADKVEAPDHRIIRAQIQICLPPLGRKTNSVCQLDRSRTQCPQGQKLVDRDSVAFSSHLGSWYIPSETHVGLDLVASSSTTSIREKRKIKRVIESTYIHLGSYFSPRWFYLLSKEREARLAIVSIHRHLCSRPRRYSSHCESAIAGLVFPDAAAQSVYSHTVKSMGSFAAGPNIGPVSSLLVPKRSTE